MSNTGSPYLDRFLNYSEIVHCIYGKSATGKTNLCLVAAAHFAKDKKVVFIDTEGSFSIDRLKQINPSLNLDNVLLFKANSFDEQSMIIDKILQLKGKVGLVIVDSLSMHYRKALQQKENPNPYMSKQLSILSEIARAGTPVLITCQVYTKQDNTNHPVGSTMVRNWSTCIIRLDNEFKRQFLLEKHPSTPSFSTFFRISDRGIEDL
jgi:DNA repair protein RadB